MKARVGMISQWYDPERGAAAVPGVIARSLLRRGHEVDVVTGFPNYPGGAIYPGYSIRPYRRDFINGATVHRVPYYPSHDSSTLRRAVSYSSFAAGATAVACATLSRTDSVYVHSTPATVALPAQVLKILRRKAFVVHIEDLWPQTVTSSGFMNVQRGVRVARVLDHYCDSVYRQAHSIAVTSPGMADAIAKRGIDEKKIVFLPNWADEDAFRVMPRNQNLASSLGLREGFTVMYAGNLGEFQGLDSLLDAAILLQANSAVSFAFVGAGVREEALREKVRVRGLSNVVFVPPQPFDRMADVLALGDVQFVGLRDIPLFRITLPSKLQATLAAGRPIIGALAGDAAQVVSDAGAGVVVVPEDSRALAGAILSLAKAPTAILEAYGLAGRIYYEKHFSEGVVGDRLSSLLESAACERRRESK